MVWTFTYMILGIQSCFMSFCVCVCSSFDIIKQLNRTIIVSKWFRHWPSDDAIRLCHQIDGVPLTILALLVTHCPMPLMRRWLWHQTSPLLWQSGGCSRLSSAFLKPVARYGKMSENVPWNVLGIPRVGGRYDRSVYVDWIVHECKLCSMISCSFMLHTVSHPHCCWTSDSCRFSHLKSLARWTKIELRTCTVKKRITTRTTRNVLPYLQNAWSAIWSLPLRSNLVPIDVEDMLQAGSQAPISMCQLLNRPPRLRRA